jgi:membrane protein DedA with SNARE-associated domain
MNIGTLIENHGYWMLAIGCLLEGETVLILAGFAAHRGYLNPVAVVAIASAAGFLGDQIYFWLGRRHGASLLARWPSLALQADRVQRLIARYHEAVIIGMRFAYGLRIAGPILYGTTPIAALRFGLFNALGALIWAFLIGAVGWVFGNVAEAIFTEIRHFEGWLLLGLASAGVLIWLVRRHKRRA